MKNLALSLLLALLCSLAVTGRADTSSNVVKLNGGLEAKMESLTRNPKRGRLTAVLRIENRGPDTAFLMLAGPGPGLSGGGDTIIWTGVKGLTACPSLRDHHLPSCIGLNAKSERLVAPLEQFTVVEAGRGIAVTFEFGSNPNSNSPVLTFASTLIYRFTAPTREPVLTEREKRSQLRPMNMSFPSVLVVDRS
jgi:hypothetical protein